MKFVAGISFLFFSFLLFQLINQFLFCPQYHFEQATAFKGENWYNPYDSINEKNWIKCNFHAHTNAWKGITDGKGNAQDIYKHYKQLGYDLACTSEYQKINYDTTTGLNRIPVYEHGYNISKIHQQVIGASGVEWLDFIFPQNLSNKQRVIDKLSDAKNAVIVLNHPHLRNGYPPSHMRFLTNYHSIEVLSLSSEATNIWDTALSYGHPVFILANDDLHNVFDTSQGGRFCTWLNVPNIQEQTIIQSLKAGRGFGMKILKINHEPEVNHMQRIKNKLPCFKKLSLLKDSLQVELSETAREIWFVGTQGVVRKIVPDVSKAYYLVKPTDTYIRIQVELRDGTELFLNPVYRYSKDPFENFSSASVLKVKSYFLYSLGLFIMTGWTLILVKIIRNRGIHLNFLTFTRKSV